LTSRGPAFDLRGRFPVCAEAVSVCAANVHFARGRFGFARAKTGLRARFSLCADGFKSSCADTAPAHHRAAMDIHETHLLAACKTVAALGAKYAADFPPATVGGQRFNYVSGCVRRRPTSALVDEAGAAAVKISAKLGAPNKAEIAPVLKQVLSSAKAKPVLDATQAQMKKLGIAAE